MHACIAVRVLHSSAFIYRRKYIANIIRKNSRKTADSEHNIIVMIIIKRENNIELVASWLLVTSLRFSVSLNDGFGCEFEMERISLPLFAFA